VQSFIDTWVLPAEEELEERAAGDQRWTIHPKMEQLKAKVGRAGGRAASQGSYCSKDAAKGATGVGLAWKQGRGAESDSGLVCQ
jgi:hypothetical protein